VPRELGQGLGKRLVVVMATYQGERFLEAQLASIAGQSVPPDAIVISDDGSSDATVALARSLAGTAPVPVTVLERPAPGRQVRPAVDRITDAFLRGVVAAGPTDLVAFADQDDVWEVDKLDRSVARLAVRPGAAFVFGDARLIDAGGSRLAGSLRDRWPVPQDWDALAPVDQFRFALRNPFATGATMVVRSELLELARPIPRGWLYDRWLSLIGTAMAGSCSLGVPVMAYRLHPGQAWGLDEAPDGRHPVRRAGAATARLARSARRLAQVRRRLAQVGAPPEIMAETRARALLGSRY
jgi:glycosyltransferase involved in cell wall biosynthesis